MADHRRSSLRTAVVWESLQAALDHHRADVVGGRRLDVLDLGGGTGGFAVKVAASGHAVTVVDPSPDALASLSRRAAEAGVSDRIRGVQGDAADLLDVVHPGSADVVLCHGVLEVVDDPEEAVGAAVACLRSAGRISVLVAQRHAAVLARALAGHLADARALLRDPDGRWGSADPVPRRFTEPEVTTLLEVGGCTVDVVHGARVFTDIVPGPLVDTDPGAVEALQHLEAEVSDRPEFRAIATQLHVVGTKR
ncbi:MAG: methyltransferase domain-containing protein [Actinomycetota bacterium]|nr:methyltransferase domain-containing protein [Actinomycetota bacterium]